MEYYVVQEERPQGKMKIKWISTKRSECESVVDELETKMEEDLKRYTLASREFTRLKKRLMEVFDKLEKSEGQDDYAELRAETRHIEWRMQSLESDLDNYKYSLGVEYTIESYEYPIMTDLTPEQKLKVSVQNFIKDYVGPDIASFVIPLEENGDEDFYYAFSNGLKAVKLTEWDWFDAYIVDPILADMLRKRKEVVIDLYGIKLWLRGTYAQALEDDKVLIECYKELAQDE